jgi:hypothetical protein
MCISFKVFPIKMRNTSELFACPLSFSKPALGNRAKGRKIKEGWD